MFMLLFALATFIRFMIYVKNYHSKFDTPFEKFILASMVSTIFLVFATHALRQAFKMGTVGPTESDVDQTSTDMDSESPDGFFRTEHPYSKKTPDTIFRKLRKYETRTGHGQCCPSTSDFDPLRAVEIKSPTVEVALEQLQQCYKLI